MFYAVFAICYRVKALNFEVGISEIILEQTIRHNNVICMKLLQRSQTLVLACLLFSETSEIILSTFEGVFHCHSCVAK